MPDEREDHDSGENPADQEPIEASARGIGRRTSDHPDDRRDGEEAPGSIAGQEVEGSLVETRDRQLAAVTENGVSEQLAADDLSDHLVPE